MKLCRFELVDQPGPIRSGIFHEGKVYETDGTKAIGIHDLTAVVLRSPVGLCPAIRMFPKSPLANGRFTFLNSTLIVGSGADVEMPTEVVGVGLSASVGVVVADRGRQIDVGEAESFILGYTLVLRLIGEFAGADADPMSASEDLAILIGPFVTTPEELEEKMIAGEATSYRWQAELKLNGDAAWAGTIEGPRFADLLSAGSRLVEMQSGEVVAGPALDIPLLPSTGFGRSLLPGDRFIFRVDGLGALTGSIT